MQFNVVCFIEIKEDTVKLFLAKPQWTLSFWFRAKRHSYSTTKSLNSASFAPLRDNFFRYLAKPQWTLS
jgi:hypothetical protein